MRVDLTASKSRFSWKEKLARGVWSYLIWPFVKFLPRAFNSLRIIVLRAAGAKIGNKCLIEPGVQVWIPWNLSLSDCVVIGRNVEIYNYGLVSVGEMSVISQYSYICTGTHDYTHPHMPLVWGEIRIGSECWVAAGCFIGPNVIVNDGAVVGAMSVVTKEVPAWSVCAGNPCRWLKERCVGDGV